MPTALEANAPKVVDSDTLRAYGDWLGRARAAPFDPYYAEATLRFGLRDDDVLVSPGDVTVRAASCGSLMESARAGVSFSVCGIDPARATDCVDALDGTRTVSEARARANVGSSTWELFVANAFGKVVFAPLALSELETRVSHVEIVRFPGSPYEIVRAYWENMGDVRARIGAAPDFVDASGFATLLRELNVLCHVGASGSNFYRPASPVVAKEGVEPGAFWQTPSVTEETPDGTRFVSGPRVGAALIGGARYQGLLARSLDEEESLSEARGADGEGLSWGRVVTARADADDRPAPWFCPPRPFGAAHLGVIAAALSDARAAAAQGRTDDAVRCAASVHYRLVRLHPFKSGNQSVAMGLVNAVLREAAGAGIPHLVLDHLAFRLSLPAYERVFHRAVGAWLVVDDSPVRRALELAARRRRLFAFLDALQNAPESGVSELLAARSADAALAFLVPGPRAGAAAR